MEAPHSPVGSLPQTGVFFLLPSSSLPYSAGLCLLSATVLPSSWQAMRVDPSKGQGSGKSISAMISASLCSEAVNMSGGDGG